MISVHAEKRQGDFLIQVAFKAPPNGITSLFGPSGAGKTSIINMIAGLLRPERGHIRINGHTLFDALSGIDLPPERRRIGYVFQEGRLFPHLTVRANLTYGMRRTPTAQRHVTLDQVVGLLGIDHLLERRPARLSGGEKQRVAIGRALLTSPELLLMDEPLASLDSRRKADILPFIARLADEFDIPILYISHAWHEIVELADTLVLVEAGRIVAAGPLAELMARLDLQHLTGGIDSGALINTIVECNAKGLTLLRFGGGILKLPEGGWPPGTSLRVHIPARHVGIALKRPEETSFQNIFAATIEKIAKASGNLYDVRMDIGCPLVARITPQAREELALQPGQPVFALIKSVGVTPADKIPPRP